MGECPAGIAPELPRTLEWVGLGGQGQLPLAQVVPAWPWAPVGMGSPSFSGQSGPPCPHREEFLNNIPLNLTFSK